MVMIIITISIINIVIDNIIIIMSSIRMIIVLNIFVFQTHSCFTRIRRLKSS